MLGEQPQRGPAAVVPEHLPQHAGRGADVFAAAGLEELHEAGHVEGARGDHDHDRVAVFVVVGASFGSHHFSPPLSGAAGRAEEAGPSAPSVLAVRLRP